MRRQVAAKIMLGSHFGDQTAIRRFEREARAAAKIDHRNITRVHDYGAVGSGGAYLIMELVAGRTWRQELQRSGIIAPARASEWFRQLLEGLQFAHKLGVVHRDLKPENVMIVDMSAAPGDSGTGDYLKIMDFGLAKVLDAGTGATESVTIAGTVMGTVGYMAPEVVNGGAIDERADIFATGVMVVETLTGLRPFRGPTQRDPWGAPAKRISPPWRGSGDSSAGCHRATLPGQGCSGSLWLGSGVGEGSGSRSRALRRLRRTP